MLHVKLTAHLSHGDPPDSRQMDVRDALHERLDAEETKITRDRTQDVDPLVGAQYFASDPQLYVGICAAVPIGVP